MVTGVQTCALPIYPPQATPLIPPTEKKQIEAHPEQPPAPASSPAGAEPTDIERVQRYMEAVETDPKTKLKVRLFSENEAIDYLHEAKDAEGKPEVMKRILDDIVATGKKRRSAIRGE
jgi:hypothetical protein